MSSPIVRKMLGESVEQPKPFVAAPLKKVIEADRPVTYQVCPHCNQEIFEKHTYIDGDFRSGEYVERHSDCGGAIEMPESDLSEVAGWLRGPAEEARTRHQAYLAKIKG